MPEELDKTKVIDFFKREKASSSENQVSAIHCLCRYAWIVALVIQHGRLFLLPSTSALTVQPCTETWACMSVLSGTFSPIIAYVARPS